MRGELRKLRRRAVRRLAADPEQANAALLCDAVDEEELARQVIRLALQALLRNCPAEGEVFLYADDDGYRLMCHGGSRPLDPALNDAASLMFSIADADPAEIGVYVYTFRLGVLSLR